MNNKVLIVDDSDFSRQTIIEMFKGTNNEIVGEAANADDALNILADNHVDIAIIDVVMPQTSGIELTKLITQKFKETYCIVISSLAHESIIIDSISAGASDYLQKPLKKELLLESVAKVISGRDYY